MHLKHGALGSSRKAGEDDLAREVQSLEDAFVSCSSLADLARLATSTFVLRVRIASICNDTADQSQPCYESPIQWRRRIGEKKGDVG